MGRCTDGRGALSPASWRPLPRGVRLLVAVALLAWLAAAATTAVDVVTPAATAVSVLFRPGPVVPVAFGDAIGTFVQTPSLVGVTGCKVDALAHAAYQGPYDGYARITASAMTMTAAEETCSAGTTLLVPSALLDSPADAASRGLDDVVAALAALDDRGKRLVAAISQSDAGLLVGYEAAGRVCGLDGWIRLEAGTLFLIGKASGSAGVTLLDLNVRLEGDNSFMVAIADPDANADAITNAIPITVADAITNAIPITVADAITNAIPITVADAITNAIPITVADAITNAILITVADANRDTVTVT
ncbi:hypothetical protein MMPV_007185 [Pyropia vietnamensis]